MRTFVQTNVSMRGHNSTIAPVNAVRASKVITKKYTRAPGLVFRFQSATGVNYFIILS